MRSKEGGVSSAICLFCVFDVVVFVLRLRNYMSYSLLLLSTACRFYAKKNGFYLTEVMCCFYFRNNNNKNNN